LVRIKLHIHVELDLNDELGLTEILVGSSCESRFVSSAATARDAPIPATQAVHPKRSKICPNTALPTKPPRK